MKRISRRQFLAVMGAAAAVSALSLRFFVHRRQHCCIFCCLWRSRHFVLGSEHHAGNPGPVSGPPGCHRWHFL